MPPGMRPISREDFEQITDVNVKLNILFEYIVNINDTLSTQKHACGERFKKLENRRWRDRGVSAVAGFFGGFFAVWTKAAWWK